MMSSKMSASASSSGFTESSFERKCAELNPSQQSIQNLSAWLVHHRKHHQTIVKIWYKEFMKAQDHRKLTFLYLANDVVQTSRKKGPEFGKMFAPVLKKAVEYMGKIPGEKTKKSILRILNIWKERGIYEANLINDFESRYLKAWDDLNGAQSDEVDDSDRDPVELLKSLASESAKSELLRSGSDPYKIFDKSKKLSGSSGTGAGEPSTSTSKKRKHRSKKDALDSELRKRRLEDTHVVDETEVDGIVQLEVKLSPSPYTEPPTEDELLKMLKELDRMPSTDAETRGQIASFPSRISNTPGVDEICVDSDAAKSLQTEIQSAYRVLDAYNKKLDIELLDRRRTSMKLQDFLQAQKDLLTQAEQRLEDHQTHEKTLLKKLDELKEHVLSMPDLTKLPSITHGLAPLPSAGDLFL